jgi:catechol 2,3-dioxygenase-like lactoylglutathione lyase family enzyme
MIGYVTVGSNDLEKARGFYDALMPVLGKPGLAVCKPYDGNNATAGNGNMSSIVCDSRARVDAVHAKAMELGGTCEGPPGLRGQEGNQAFYGAYFRDLDGNKLCAFKIGPAD